MIKIALLYCIPWIVDATPAVTELAPHRVVVQGNGQPITYADAATPSTSIFNVKSSGTTFAKKLIVSGGVSIRNTGFTVMNGGISALDVGLSVTGGMSVSADGFKCIGGLTLSGQVSVMTKGMTVTGGLTAVGISVIGGLTVGDNADGALVIGSRPITQDDNCNPKGRDYMCISGSDMRYKLNTITMEPGNALRQIMATRPVSYMWREDAPFGLSEDRRTQVGFIAQELEEALDHEGASIVHRTASPSGGEILTVDYGRLTALLAGAIQAQEAEINEIASRIGLDLS